MRRSPFDRLMKGCIKHFRVQNSGVKVVYFRNVEGKHCRRRFPIDAVFDDDFEAVGFDNDGRRISSRTTQIGIHKNALPFSPRRGDQVKIGDVVYDVAEAQPDSEFGLTLILRK